MSLSYILIIFWDLHSTLHTHLYTPSRSRYYILLTISEKSIAATLHKYLQSIHCAIYFQLPFGILWNSSLHLLKTKLIFVVEYYICYLSCGRIVCPAATVVILVFVLSNDVEVINANSIWFFSLPWKVDRPYWEFLSSLLLVFKNWKGK